MANIVCSCENLTLERSNKILLENANIEINAGEITWVVGKSGCGKTSLAEYLTGILYANGKIDLNWNESSPYLAKVSYVSQFSQFKDKYGMCDFYYQQRFNSYDGEMTVTVEEYLKEFLSNERIKFSLDKLIELFNFKKKLSSSLLYLSSGERKKLQLIKTLSNPTQLIILDNPFTGLDKLSLIKLDDYITDLSKSGIAVVIIDRVKTIFKACKQIILFENKKLLSLNKEEYLTKNTDLASNNSRQFVDKIGLTQWRCLNNYQVVVKFSKVSVTYGNKNILNNIDWQIKAGEKWLLDGENGAGKSTILSLINGDNPQAYANDIWLFDKKRGSGETIWDIKSKIGYISPELQWNFAHDLTCLEVVLTGYFDTPGLYAKATEEEIDFAKELLAKLNFAEYSNQSYSRLSNGIQRSILLIRALIKKPPLLIFDEPCQGMVEEQSEFFVRLIDSLLNESEKTIIYVTHRIDEIPKCLNKKLTIKDGCVIKNEEIK